MLLVIILLALISLPHYSQQITEWQNYTDLKNVKAVDIVNNTIWAGADGGVFSYDILSNSFAKFSKTEGLNGVSVTSAAIDKYGKAWFGSSNGIIDAYNPETNSFRTILDIFNNSEKTLKAINHLIAKGDTIFAATDFGISLINAKDYLFYDTFSKFGNLPSNIKVNSVLVTDLVYACTNEGIAIQKAGTTNLSAPESWLVYNNTNGLPSNTVNKAAVYNNSIVAATSNGLSAFDGSVWVSFIPDLAGININDIITAGDSLFILTDNTNIYRFNNGQLNLIYSASGVALLRLSFSPSTGLIAASSSGIFKLNNAGFLFPNGPGANKFPDLSVDQNGLLWSASGSDASAVGFYSYDGNEWINYNTSTTPELTSNTYFRVFTASDGKKIFGNWGQGIAVYDNGEIKSYKDNLDMLGTQNDPNYIVITGIAEDSKKNIWLLNYGAADRKNLSSSADFENWTSHSISAIGNTYVDEVFELAIDEYDTKWFAVQRGKQGLFYFNEGNMSDPDDDISGFLTTGSGLNHNFVRSVVVDRRGDLWVGTSLGVNIISNVRTVLTSNPQLRISSV